MPFVAEVFKQIESPWFLVALVLAVLLFISERAYYRARKKHIDDIRELTEEWEKAAAKIQEKHAADMETIQKARNVIWFKGEVRPPETPGPGTEGKKNVH